MNEQSSKYCGIIGLCAAVFGSFFPFPVSLMFGVIGGGLAVLAGVFGQRILGAAGAALWGLSSLWSPVGTTFLGATLLGGLEPPNQYSNGMIIVWGLAILGIALSIWAPYAAQEQSQKFNQ